MYFKTPNYPSNHRDNNYLTIKIIHRCTYIWKKSGLNKLWKMFWAHYSLDNQNHGILGPWHPAVEEMKIAYLGDCYGKAEAGKSGEHHTHHQNRSPSKGEKISNSNNSTLTVPVICRWLHTSSFIHLCFFLRSSLLPYFHFPNVWVWQKVTCAEKRTDFSSPTKG